MNNKNTSENSELLTESNSDYYKQIIQNKGLFESLNNTSLVDFFNQFERDDYFAEFQNQHANFQIYSTFLIKQLKLNSSNLNSKLTKVEISQLEAQMMEIFEGMIYQYFSKLLSGFDKDDISQSKARKVYLRDFANSICRNLGQIEEWHLKGLALNFTENLNDVYLESQVLNILGVKFANLKAVAQAKNQIFSIYEFVKNYDFYLSNQDRVEIKNVLDSKDK